METQLLQMYDIVSMLKTYSKLVVTWTNMRKVADRIP